MLTDLFAHILFNYGIDNIKILSNFNKKIIKGIANFSLVLIFIILMFKNGSSNYLIFIAFIISNYIEKLISNFKSVIKTYKRITIKCIKEEFIKNKKVYFILTIICLLILIETMYSEHSHTIIVFLFLVFFRITFFNYHKKSLYNFTTYKRWITSYKKNLRRMVRIVHFYVIWSKNHITNNL